MPKCGNCGKTFDVDDARSEFDAFDEWAGELTYDEDVVDPYDEGIEEHSICGSCAIAVTVENLGGGSCHAVQPGNRFAPGGCARRLEPFGRLSVPQHVSIAARAAPGMRLAAETWCSAGTIFDRAGPIQPAKSIGRRDRLAHAFHATNRGTRRRRRRAALFACQRALSGLPWSAGRSSPVLVV